MSLALQLNRLQISARRRHVTVIMVLDRSHSMNAKYHQSGGVRGPKKSRLEVASEGACGVIDELDGDDHAAVLAFSDEIDNISGGAIELTSHNKSVLKQRIRGLKTNGGTKLYDTILAATQIVFRGAAAARLAENAISHDFGSFWLVVLTDGEDTHSTNTISDVIDVFRKLRALDAVVVNTALIGVNLSEGPKRKMHQMADAGGSTTKFTDARDMQEVTNAFGEIRVRMSVERMQVPISGVLGARASTISDQPWSHGSIPKGAHVRVLGHSRGAAGVSVGDVGVAKARDSDDDYVVDFPHRDNWCAASSDIVIDPEAERVRPGAIVAVKKSVSDPMFGWGAYERNMHGMVVEVKHDGVVRLQLGLNADGGSAEGLWTSQLKELEVVDPGDFQARQGHWKGSKLQVGMAVRVPSYLSEPSTKWGMLKRGEVGYVRGYKPFTDMYVCDFPSVDGWHGRASDLIVDSVATVIRPGKFVRVRPSVANPKGGWAGVTPSSIGLVTSCSHDGGVTISFPEHSEWRGTLAELETVKAPAGHTAFCDACQDGKGIQGSRFKCMSCHDYDLCQDCYDKGRHDMSHRFWRIDNRDSKALEQSTRPAPSVPSKPYRSIASPATATAVPGPFEVSPADPIVVDAVPVPTTFVEGQQVRITGLVGDSELNGQFGSILKSLGSDKYCVKLSHRDDKKIVKSVNLEGVVADSPFPIGSIVETVGLVNAKENDKVGQVMQYDPRKNRVLVQIFDEDSRQMSLRPENLALLEEAD